MVCPSMRQLVGLLSPSKFEVGHWRRLDDAEHIKWLQSVETGEYVVVFGGLPNPAVRRLRPRALATAALRRKQRPAILLAPRPHEQRVRHTAAAVL